MIFNSAQVIKKLQFEEIEIDDWDVICDGFPFFFKSEICNSFDFQNPPMTR